ncbi:hypothetical protein MUK42_07960 [Musa troglodytarum]|uniref:Uncharacterized protein n=2 Tax=Musa troglodytarum TaxID=320322 RepID=A0A9E7HIY6_9LILI|nr:hypothetical protein MUK42_07960 [Musa troglodytarum]
MERSSSFGMSWADQWDYSEPSATSQKSNSSSNLKKGMEKTKAATSTGIKKVKEGTSHGLQWIKAKCSMKSQKH